MQIGCNAIYIRRYSNQLQWLWHSWQCCHFRYQRIRVRIKSSATLIEQLFYSWLFVERTKIRKRCSYKGSLYLSLRRCFIPWNLYLESSRSKTRSCWSEQLIWERFIKPLLGGPAFKNTKQFILFFTFKTKFMLLVCSLLGRSISSIASLIKRPKITLLTFDSTARFSISVWFD